MATLASLQQKFTENCAQIKFLLEMKNYDGALVAMDDRLILVDHLLRLVAHEPSLEQDVILLAAMLSQQEESMINLASYHHQTVFQELSSIGMASKVKKFYSVNSKEF
ncbi:hypothetical protein [Aeromonas hydrophila]|uniref:hypothetical protein n=1 Tax=Aeromonas hydrophila TaxID=644 RepID=UPI00191FFCB9|nr:hypothetical protein [Aeromonas hydrophila]MBL0560688.1 hypothetical protein [Aeromonas hydrophila]